MISVTTRHAGEVSGMHARFGSENPKGMDSKEHLQLDGNILLKCPLQKYYRSVQSGFNWPKIGLNNGLF
jgi:hypothetical protein